MIDPRGRAHWLPSGTWTAACGCYCRDYTVFDWYGGQAVGACKHCLRRFMKERGDAR